MNSETANFGSASALLACTKEAANHKYDLHFLLSSPFPEVPFQGLERRLASPFLTIAYHF
jgi:hypothetical protein